MSRRSATADVSGNKILSVTGTNADGTSWTLSVGDRVEHPADDCDPDSGDTGRISSFVDRENAVVYWDSDVETTCEIEKLVSL